ncbi:MAG: NAD(P)H-dependent glycerol-3-phosphate dehydrogenase [Nitrospinota bacterium]
MFDEKVVVIGAGSWGTAIAKTLAINVSTVSIWGREEAVVDSINNHHESSLFLPGIKLPTNIKAYTNLSDAIEGATVIFFVIPSQFMRSVMIELSKLDFGSPYFVSATKGIENEHLAFPSNCAMEILPPPISEQFMTLSGPTFAIELAKELPTAVTVASRNHRGAKFVQSRLANSFLRIYLDEDIVGVELAGAYKNVIAIGSGISDGLMLGDNARAALITRGLVEMSRLGLKLGANERTFRGLAGIGDLTLTCTGSLSRNRQVGLRLGAGESMDSIFKSTHQVAEGVATSLSIVKLGKKLDVSLPIANMVYDVIYKGQTCREGVKILMARELKSEFAGF